jgi:hypothetical protein
VRRDQGDRPAVEHLFDQHVYQCRGMFSGQVDGAELSLRFGPDMAHLPGRPALLHHRQNVIGRLCDPAGVGDSSGLGGRCQRRPHHRHHGAMSAQHGCGLVEPGRALLS